MKKQPTHYHVQVVMPVSEADDVKRAAKSEGLTLSMWCRRILIAVARERLSESRT